MAPPCAPKRGTLSGARLAAAQAAVDMDRIWDEHDSWTVPEPAATEVARAGFTYGACVGSLARYFASDAGGKKKCLLLLGSSTQLLI